MNLGAYYQDEGLLEQAREMLSRAASVTTQQPSVLQLRIALLMPPVEESWASMLRHRASIRASLQHILGNQSSIVPSPLQSHLDRIHFYIVYAGLNDRSLQELIITAYHICIAGLQYIAPSLTSSGWIDATDNRQGTSSASLTATASRRVRVGFMSKYFGIYEPHGLLLDGVVRYLPKSRFEVLMGTHY